MTRVGARRAARRAQRARGHDDQRGRRAKCVSQGQCSMRFGMIRIRDVVMRLPSGGTSAHDSRRRHARRRRGRGLRDHRPLGQRQVDAAGAHRRTRPPERGLDRRRRRRDHAARRGRARAVPPRHARLRLPVLSSDPDADRRGERGRPARDRRARANALGRARALARRRRARRARASLSGPALGRRAAARGARPRGRARSRAAPGRRADRQSRLRHRAPQIIELLLALNRRRGSHAACW